MYICCSIRAKKYTRFGTPEDVPENFEDHISDEGTTYSLRAKPEFIYLIAPILRVLYFDSVLINKFTPCTFVPAKDY